MRALLFLGGGILIGAGLVHGEARVYAEKKAAEKFEEQLESHKRVLEMAALDFVNREVDGPYENEEDLEVVSAEGVPETEIFVTDASMVSSSGQEVGPAADYLKIARDYTTAVGDASGVIPIEYISEDDYNEEDGRSKEQILIHMSLEGDPLFMNEGIVLEDWKSLISPNILVDMYQRCPPGEDTKVLYVRNHVTDTDYEVLQEFP